MATENSVCKRWGTGAEQCVLPLEHLGPCELADGFRPVTAFYGLADRIAAERADERPRWRVWWRDRSFPVLVLPAETESLARRDALLMGPAGGIRKIERVRGER